MAYALKTQIDQVTKSHPGPAFVESSDGESLAYDGDHLEVEHLGREQELSIETGPCSIAVGVVIGKRRRDH